MAAKSDIKKITIILYFICALSMGSAWSAEDSSDSGDVIIPPGMEVIKEGDVSVVVPKGGRLRKHGSVMLIETADEYASRKFEDTDERFRKMEQELQVQKQELEDLKGTVKKSEEDGRKK
ncbi:MAG: hypothetical protein Q7S30_02875 [Candidatus Omnitrophota bacterium]|nr:hypothetical protein [Candidatus Omnitrophota bacterium]